MSRTAKFDPYDVLHRAMAIFWRKGYEATSIGNLVAATGVSRYGLYHAFKNKRGLFFACLDYYQATIVSAAFGIVEQAEASLESIHAYFGIVSTDSTNRGCLMANTASGVASYDDGARRKVAAFRARLQVGFKTALLRAKDQGKLPSHLNAGQIADFLTGVTQAISILLRSSADREIIQNMLSVSLSCLHEIPR